MGVKMRQLNSQEKPFSSKHANLAFSKETWRNGNQRVAREQSNLYMVHPSQLTASEYASEIPRHFSYLEWLLLEGGRGSK